MIKLKTNRKNLRNITPLLRKASRLWSRRRVRIEASTDYGYEYKTYSCLQVPTSPLVSKEIVIMYLLVRHEVDVPCRVYFGQVVEIDRERSEE